MNGIHIELLNDNQISDGDAISVIWLCVCVGIGNHFALIIKYTETEI